MSGQITSQLLFLAKFFLYAWFHCVSCTVYSNWKAGLSLLLLFCALFLLFLLFLVCWHLLLLFPNWLSPPFQPGLKHLNIRILIININSRKMKMPSLKWTRMRFFELRLGLPVLAPPWGELLSSPDSGKSSLWTPGSPTFRLGPGRISGKKQREVQLFHCCAIVWLLCNCLGEKCCSFTISPSVGGQRGQSQLALHNDALRSNPLFVPHIADHSPFCILKIISDQYVLGRHCPPMPSQTAVHLWNPGRKVPTSKNGSHLKNQVDCFPAHELRRGHPSKLFLVDKPVEVDVKQPEKHPWFILLALMNIATAAQKTNLNAVTATLCQYWSLSLSNALNWSPMLSCLMCRIKSFFLTWEKSESPQATELGDTKPSIWTKVWTRAGAYLSIGVGNLAELLNMLLGQLDAVGVAHQDVLFDRDRSIPRCVRFLKQLTQCWKIYESPTLPWRVSLQSMHVTTWLSLNFKVAKNLEKLHLPFQLFREIWACLPSAFLRISCPCTRVVHWCWCTLPYYFADFQVPLN